MIARIASLTVIWDYLDIAIDDGFAVAAEPLWYYQPGDAAQGNRIAEQSLRQIPFMAHIEDNSTAGLCQCPIEIRTLSAELFVAAQSRTHLVAEQHLGAEWLDLRNNSMLFECRSRKHMSNTP
jgi:hypothetical protein